VSLESSFHLPVVVYVAVGDDLPHNFIRDCDITTRAIPSEGSMTESLDLSVDDSNRRRFAGGTPIATALKFLTRGSNSRADYFPRGAEEKGYAQLYLLLAAG